VKEGFWINYETGLEVEIDEHESWIRRPGNVQRLGIPAEIAARFGEFAPIVDRERFLTFVMSHAPVMRIRGHGAYVSFEFAIPGDTTMAVERIRRFCDRNEAGAKSARVVSNSVHSVSPVSPTELPSLNGRE